MTLWAPENMAEIFGFSHVPIKSMGNTVYYIVSLSKEHDQIKISKICFKRFFTKRHLWIEILERGAFAFLGPVHCTCMPQFLLAVANFISDHNFHSKFNSSIDDFLIIHFQKIHIFLWFCFLKNATFLAPTSFQRMQSALHFFNMISIRSFLQFLTDFLIFLLVMDGKW